MNDIHTYNLYLYLSCGEMGRKKMWDTEYKKKTAATQPPTSRGIFRIRILHSILKPVSTQYSLYLCSERCNTSTQKWMRCCC